jgi:hypothetical protein
MLKWRLLPHWTKEPIKTQRPINARLDIEWTRPRTVQTVEACNRNIVMGAKQEGVRWASNCIPEGGQSDAGRIGHRSKDCLDSCDEAETDNAELVSWFLQQLRFPPSKKQIPMAGYLEGIDNMKVPYQCNCWEAGRI